MIRQFGVSDSWSEIIRGDSFVCKMIVLVPHLKFVLQSKFGIQLFSHLPNNRLENEVIVVENFPYF